MLCCLTGELINSLCHYSEILKDNSVLDSQHNPKSTLETRILYLSLKQMRCTLLKLTLIQKLYHKSYSVVQRC